MSDFDREAEREKLREKYERDKQKREASERMSELLLQGATMTNRHCPECQSPVFRYEGSEFCPTCEKEVAEDGESLQGDESTSAGTEAPGPEADDPETKADTDPKTGTAGETGQSDAEAGTEPGSAPETDPRPADSTQPSPYVRDADRDEGDPESTAGSPPRPARDRRPARVDPPASGASRRGADADRSGPDGSGERITGEAEYGTLREAERTLVEEIATLSRRAAETRDVGRKRDLLAAAREAAETLEAVRRL